MTQGSLNGGALLKGSEHYAYKQSFLQTVRDTNLYPKPERSCWQSSNGGYPEPPLILLNGYYHFFHSFHASCDDSDLYINVGRTMSRMLLFAWKGTIGVERLTLLKWLSKCASDIISFPDLLYTSMFRC